MDTQFRETWVVDFEYRQPDGELPEIRCMIAVELASGNKFKLWANELANMEKPPFSIGKDSLMVAYYATAELNCFRVLDWPMPQNILDLYAEFKWKFCGRSPPAGFGLLGALYAYNLPEVVEKDEMRALAMREGTVYSDTEKRALLDYCQEDVVATSKLLKAMWKELDLSRALLRGRYVAGVSAMETNGIPIDTGTFYRLRDRWEDIKAVLIETVDADFGVFEGTTFKMDRFEAYLKGRGLTWPRLPSGALDLKRDTFREMARSHSAVAPLHELRHTLSELRLNRLAVGRDGRNRCMLSPFGSKTARNLPSNAKFIFGPSTWLRSLIRPWPGTAVAYIDYSQQEFAIAAVLSEDAAMQDAYLSGDPYLKFGQQAGVIPVDGTKESHPEERKLFKACALGVQYGMGGYSLAGRIGGSVAAANMLIKTHKRTYRKYWSWVDAVVNHALLYGSLTSTLGWQIHVGKDPNIRALGNWPVQTNGSEILRVAIILLVEAGIKVCAPVHDAILIESSLDRVEQDVETAQNLMREASKIVLGGFEVRTEAEVIKYPNRYKDERGARMWSKVIEILERVDKN
jgi:hypothetical protein